MKMTSEQIEMKYKSRTWIMAKWGIALAVIALGVELVRMIVVAIVKTADVPALPITEILLFAGALIAPMGVKTNIKEGNRPKIEGVDEA